MNQKETNNLYIRPHHIIIPILLGIAAVTWLLLSDINGQDFPENLFSRISLTPLILILAFISLREWGYMWRYKLLTRGDLSWIQCFKVTMLCEFSSTITPSAVGGSSLAMLFMAREGVNAGRGTTITLITIFLDELFFVITCPIILMIETPDRLFAGISDGLSSGISASFWIIYTIITAWTIILFFGIFIKPDIIKKGIVALFKLGFLKRFREKADDFSDNIIEASHEARQMTMPVWLKSFIATALSWSARYLMVCFLFIAFSENSDQLLVFARQSVVWLILMVTPTPGGSGISEWLFTSYYSDIVSTSSMALVLALAWRILSYYLYLIIGLCVLPYWLKKNNKIKIGK